MTKYTITIPIEAPDDMDPSTILDVASQYAVDMAEDLATYLDEIPPSGPVPVVDEDGVCVAEDRTASEAAAIQALLYLAGSVISGCAYALDLREWEAARRHQASKALNLCRVADIKFTGVPSSYA